MVLWLISTILSFRAIGQPLTIEERIIENKIEERTTFDYSAIVYPSTLYPTGGRVTSNGVIFNNITDKLIIKLDSSIMSDKPVKVEGSTRVVYSLVAKDMWEREFELIPTKTINIEGTSNSLIQEEMRLDVDDILAFIKKIEEETQVRPSNYLLIIEPKLTGTVYGEDGNIINEIGNDLEIPFEISGQYIRYAAESPEKEIIRTKVVEKIQAIPQSFNLFGKEISVVSSRYIFGIISIILLITLLIAAIEKVMSKKEKVTEVSLIDKKNKSKIIEVTENINFGELSQLSLKSFKALLQIAEEKEEPILRYADNIEETVYYYVLGATIVYYYCSSENNLTKGSELAHDS